MQRFAKDWHRNLELDLPVAKLLSMKEENMNSKSASAPKSSTDEDMDDDDDYQDPYLNKKFIKSNYAYNCLYKLHLILYPFL